MRASAYSSAQSSTVDGFQYLDGIYKKGFIVIYS
jgi:hypothetical protein